MASVARQNLVNYGLRNPVLLMGQHEERNLSVIVDYNQPINEMVKLGNYSRVSEEIPSKFKVSGSGFAAFSLGLIHFSAGIVIPNIEKYMNAMGLAPAKIEHLLALGYMYPTLQLWYPIVALGSKWAEPGGAVNAPVLNGFNRERSLGLYLANEFAEHHGCRRFLVIEQHSGV